MNNENYKTAIISGGSRGLGRNTAVNLARRGVDILFTYHSNAAEAQSLIREAEAIGRKAAAFQLDAGNISSFDGFVDDIRNTLRGWGRERFDYLVNNAGTSLHKPFDQTTEAEFDQIVNVHFKGVYFFTQKLLPLIRDGGRIVNISSGLARVSIPALQHTERQKAQSRCSRATWLKNLDRAGLQPTWLPRGRSRPISAAAWSATIRKSTSASRR